MKKLKILCLLFITTAISSNGQDSQYWSKQYGTYGGLLGGTVIGASSDLSATYYNPGTIAFLKDSTLLLTTNSFQFIYLNFNNFVDSDLKLDSWYTNASQGIFALRLPINWLGDDQLVVSFITRQDFSFNSIGRDIIPYYSQNYKSNQFSLDQNLNEYWLGLTWSSKISDMIGFGVTMYVPYRSQKVVKQTIIQSFNEIEKTKNLITMIDYNYYNLRLLWKAGISLQLGKVMLGLSLTSPSINLSGSGSASVLFSKANADSLNEVYPNLSSNFQENLSTNYKSPMSIGFGAAYYWNSTTIYFSAEWFNNVNSYPVMSPKSFIGQSTGRVFNYNANYSLRSVFNFGFGIKYTFNKNFIYYGGITTDKTAYDPDSQNPFVLSTWDIVHILSGAELKFNNLSLTLGLSYGYSGTLFENFNFLGIFQNNQTDVIYHQVNVIFGLTYSL